jgi:hypothetical protein
VSPSCRSCTRISTTCCFLSLLTEAQEAGPWGRSRSSESVSSCVHMCMCVYHVCAWMFICMYVYKLLILIQKEWHVCVCVCMYVFICESICIHVSGCMCDVYMYVCVHVCCENVCIFVFTCVCKQMHVCAHMCVLMCVCICVHKCAYIHGVCVCVCIQATHSDSKGIQHLPAVSFSPPRHQLLLVTF